MHPAFVNHNAAFHTEPVAEKNIPTSLRKEVLNFLKLYRNYFGKQCLLTKIVVDFEACLDTTTTVSKRTPGGVRSKYMNIVHGVNNSAGSPHNANLHAAHSSTCTTGGPASGVLAPHLLNGINDPHMIYHFR